MSPSARVAPTDVESYGLPWSGYSHRYSVHFEMHDRSLWERRGPEYLEALRDSPVPVYMQRVEPDIPQSVAFPLDDAIALGGDYFNSSIAYMLALAALMGHDVNVYGVDNHTDGEWWFERPCNEYWIGLLRGQGRRVWVHPDSSLLRFMPDIHFQGETQHYRQRYGWL